MAGARIGVSGGGDVDVAWAGPDGVFDADAHRRHLGRAGRGLPDPAGRRSRAPGRGPAPRVRPRERRPAERDRGRLSSGGGPWTFDEVDDGVDTGARLAVDADGHLHVTYLQAFPAPEVRYATDAGGSWETDVVTRSWTWLDPAFAVDAAGHHHVAVSRIGTQPGLWYGTDAGGSWAMERVTTAPTDGSVGLAVAPDGEAFIVYGEATEAEENQVAERTAWLASGGPGAWTLDLHVADDAAAGTHAIVRAADGTLHVAFGIDAGGERRIAYATDATGSSVVEPVGPGSSVIADRIPRSPSTRPVTLYSPTSGPPSRRIGTSILYATNASGSWVISQRTTGAPHDLGPRIALDAAGRPRIAFLREGSGVRLQAFTGSSWTSKTVSSGADDADPSLAIDAAGRAHVLFAASGTHDELSVGSRCARRTRASAGGTTRPARDPPAA